MRTAAQPGLYDPAAETPSLAGSRCGECGRIAFPPVAIGCDVCGSGEGSLETVDLETAGRLHSFGIVRRHHGDIDVPFAVGEVRLDAGPLIRAMMAPGQGELAIGQRMHAVWQVTRAGDQGDEVAEPAFVAVQR
jgi:uncharacterized OB-fold protein